MILRLWQRKVFDLLLAGALVAADWETAMAGARVEDAVACSAPLAAERQLG